MGAGKWPGTVAIAGAVNDGHLSWDTRAGEVFSWWTRNPNDPKFAVTLKHILQFVDGFYLYSPFMGHLQIPCMQLNNIGDEFTSLEDCAKQIYVLAQFSTSRVGHWPADNKNYNSLHQVLALAMATKTPGLKPAAYLDKYLYK